MHPLPHTLIICEGNMFRSRAAAALLRKSIGRYLASHNAAEVIPPALLFLLKPTISSAGLYTNTPRHTKLSEYQFYKDHKEEFRKVFSEFGLETTDLDDAVSQEVTIEMVLQAGTIYCFNDDEIGRLKKKFPDRVGDFEGKIRKVSNLGGEDFDITDPSTRLTPESARAMLDEIKKIIDGRDFLTDFDRDDNEFRRSIE